MDNAPGPLQEAPSEPLLTSSASARSLADHVAEKPLLDARDTRLEHAKPACPDITDARNPARSPISSATGGGNVLSEWIRQADNRTDAWLPE